MEHFKKLAAARRNRSCDIDNAIKETTDQPIAAGRRARAGFSDSFVYEDLELLHRPNEQESSSPAHPPDDDCRRSLDTETASTTSDSEAHAHGHSPLNPSVHWRGFLGMLKKGSGKKLHTLPVKNVPKLTRRKSKRARDIMVPPFSSTLRADDLCYLKSNMINFSLAELEAATDNFSRENVIGEGGYGEVYKGQLPNKQFVAIKRLIRGTPEEMTMDYLSELGIIVHVSHPNIAKLIGYGVEGGMHLVLQLSPHGSLASLLYGSKDKLSWPLRYKIALGTAEGLFYLHEGCQRRIIHKDIKAANILLSEDFDAMISDFGLAKWLPDQWTHHTLSKIEGTFGYLPPEFFMHGIVDEKTDVYAYGVLLLELITGRQALDSSQQSLVMWAKPLMACNKDKELLDPILGDVYDPDQLNRLILTASLCIHSSAIERPQMNQVVQILKGEISSLDLAKEVQKPKLQRSYSVELLDAQEYNSTKYLSDMNQHMQTILGISEPQT